MATTTRDTTPSFSDWLTTTTRALGYARDSDLARALDVDQSVISRWKRGSQPSVKHLATVSEITGTPITALLVLAGYLPRADERFDEAMTALSSPGERVIKEAQLPAILKDELRTYWNHRMNEELGRLVQLVHVIHRTAGGNLTSDRIVAEIAAKVFVSNLSNHVADLLSSSADVVERLDSDRKGSPRKEPPDAREAGTEAANARES